MAHMNKFCYNRNLMVHFFPVNKRLLHTTPTVCQRKAAVLLDAASRAKDLPPLQTNGWSLVTGRDAISKSFQFSNFNEAWSWMTSIAIAAEKMDHHPEWFNVYNKVDVTWSTHDCSGLSNRDIKMANFCDNKAKLFGK